MSLETNADIVQAPAPYTADSLSPLNELEQSVVDVCDITDVPTPVLNILGADVIMTRVDLVNAFVQANPTKRKLAALMLLETIRGEA